MQIQRIEGNEDGGYTVFDSNGKSIISFVAGTIGHLHLHDTDRWEESAGTSPSGEATEIYTLKPEPFPIDAALERQVIDYLSRSYSDPHYLAVRNAWSPDNAKQAFDAGVAAGASEDDAEAIVMAFDHFYAERQHAPKQPCSAYTIYQAARCAICGTEAHGPFYCPEHKG